MSSGAGGIPEHVFEPSQGTSRPPEKKEKKGQLTQGQKEIIPGKSDLDEHEQSAVLQKLPTEEENRQWVKKEIAHSPEVSSKIKQFQERLLSGIQPPPEESAAKEKSEKKSDSENQGQRSEAREERREAHEQPRSRTPDPNVAPSWVKEAIARPQGATTQIARLQEIAIGKVPDESKKRPGKMPELPLGDAYHKEKLAQAEAALKRENIDNPTEDQVQTKANELITKDIDLHRNPPKVVAEPKSYDAVCITEKMKPIINKKIEEYQKANSGDFIDAPADKSGKKPSPPDDKLIDPKNFEAQRRFLIAKSKFKEEACLEVYGSHINQNIKDEWFNPKVIVEEMKRNLNVTDEIPANISRLAEKNLSLSDSEGKPNKDLLKALEKQLSNELDEFTLKFEKTPDGELTSTRLLSKEGKERIMHELEHVLKSYAKAFPNKSPEDAYILCRDMARIAVYQGVYDRKAFTGSDHTEKHIHHNCENGANIKKQMVADGKKLIQEGQQLIQEGKADEGNRKVAEGTKMVQDAEISPKDSLIMRVMHFYHDLGYSVGAAGKNFLAAKDHPFIGAKFIEENQAYFTRLLDSESTEALHKAVLQHAIVSFDSTPTEGKNGVHLNMIRFITSNSDACAVTYDQKTQSFFFENPQTLQALARLKLFLTIFPKYGEFNKKLANSDIVKLDRSSMASIAGLNPDDKLDKAAMEIFLETRDALISAANQKTLPANEKKAFVEAIMNQFNSMSGDIVLAQYGAKLTGVGVDLNPNFNPGDPNKGPKYIPQVEMAPSALYGVLNALYGTDTAGKQIVKLCMDEYGADKAALNERLARVGIALAEKQFLDPNAKIEPLEIQAPGANIRIVPKPSLDPVTDAGAIRMAASLERLNMHTDVAKIRKSVGKLTEALEKLADRPLNAENLAQVTDWNNELVSSFAYKEEPGMEEIAKTMQGVQQYVENLLNICIEKNKKNAPENQLTQVEVKGLIANLNEIVARSANARFNVLVSK